MPLDSERGKSPGRPSLDRVKLFQQYGQKSPFTKTKAQTDEEAAKMLEDLLAWEPPEYMKANFPYYFAGYSRDNHPVWIVEGGKFDIAKLVCQAPEMVDAAEIYMEQGLSRVAQTMFDVSAPDEVRKAQVVLDKAGTSFQKLWSPTAIAFMFKMARRYIDAAEFALERAIGINVNYIVRAIKNVLSPILGQLMDRIELYGSDEEVWMARLQEIMPLKSVPEKFGGTLNLQPADAVSMDLLS